MNRVLALSTTIGGDTPFSPATNFPDFGKLVSVIITNATVLAGILAFIFIIIGGFAIIVGAGGGDAKQLEKGKKTLTMAVVGLLVVVFALWIVGALKIILGVDPLNPFK